MGQVSSRFAFLLHRPFSPHSPCEELEMSPWQHRRTLRFDFLKYDEFMGGGLRLNGGVQVVIFSR